MITVKLRKEIIPKFIVGCERVIMKKSLYLLEFGPSNEQILEQIAVQAQLEKIINNYAQSLNLEIDSCDILSDYIAITFYLNSLVDVDAVILALKKNKANKKVKTTK